MNVEITVTDHSPVTKIELPMRVLTDCIRDYPEIFIEALNCVTSRWRLNKGTRRNYDPLANARKHAQYFVDKVKELDPATRLLFTMLLEKKYDSEE